MRFPPRLQLLRTEERKLLTLAPNLMWAPWEADDSQTMPARRTPWMMPPISAGTRSCACSGQAALEATTAEGLQDQNSGIVRGEIKLCRESTNIAGSLLIRNLGTIVMTEDFI